MDRETLKNLLPMLPLAIAIGWVFWRQARRRGLAFVKEFTLAIGAAAVIFALWLGYVCVTDRGLDTLMPARGLDLVTEQAREVARNLWDERNGRP